MSVINASNFIRCKFLDHALNLVEYEVIAFLEKLVLTLSLKLNPSMTWILLFIRGHIDQGQPGDEKLSFLKLIFEVKLSSKYFPFLSKSVWILRRENLWCRSWNSICKCSNIGYLGHHKFQQIFQDVILIQEFWSLNSSCWWILLHAGQFSLFCTPWWD